MNWNFTHHHHHGPEVESLLRAILHKLDKLDVLNTKLEALMANLDEVLADVTDESTKIDGLMVLVDGIKQQLKDALEGATLPAGVQAKIDAVFAGVETNKAKVQAAIDANTPASPAGPVVAHSAWAADPYEKVGIRDDIILLIGLALVGAVVLGFTLLYYL